MSRTLRLKAAKPLDEGQSWRFISRIATAFAESTEILEEQHVQKLLGALRSRSLLSALEAADLLGLQQYNTPGRHFSANQLAQLIKKVPFSDPLVDPESNAMKKFMAAEHTCRRTNQRLRAENVVGRYGHHALRERARGWIRRVIGLKPDLAAIYELCNFGPGASVGVHGTATHTAAKLCSEKWTVTPAALDFARSALIGDDHVRELLLGDPRYASHSRDDFRREILRRTELVEANKIITVPKTAKVHRTIAIEPLLNGYVQKGVDEFLRDKLLRVGIDLTDQTHNQQLAYAGSLGGFNPFSTIDLSSASDSIAIETVKDLLPPDWFFFLNALRSPCYKLADGRGGRFEKFSSMGNGFCFPLETLIFASLAYSVCVETGDAHFSVYGDDIIVRQSAALYLLEILKYYGFRANNEKTFIIGPFRESCGADFFEGINVRPYTLDFVPRFTRDFFKVHNGLVDHPFTQSNTELLEMIRQYVPVRERFVRPCYGPPDTALTVEQDVFMSSPFAKWDRGIQTWTWREFVSASIADVRRAPPSVQMYGLLRGNRSLWNGQVEYALRRKSRTSVRVVP
jgi:hypothetical protein